MSTGWLLEEDLVELTVMRAVSMVGDHGGWTRGVNESEEISRAYHNREWLRSGMARKLTLVLVDEKRHLYKNGVGHLWGSSG